MASTTKRSGAKSKAPSKADAEPEVRVVPMATLQWEKGVRGVYTAKGEPVVVTQSPTDGKWHVTIEHEERGVFNTLSGAKDGASRMRGEDTDPVKVGIELAEALGALGATTERDEMMARATALDNKRDAAVSRAKTRVANYQKAKAVTAKAKKAGVDVSKVVPIKKAAAAKASPTKKAATKSTAKKAGGETNSRCPDCGFEFSTPKARCGSRTACLKRQAEGGVGKATKAASKKVAPKRQSTNRVTKATPKRSVRAPQSRGRK